MPQTCRRRYQARRRLGFAVSTGRVIASEFLLEISTMAGFDTIIRHGTIATASETYKADVGIKEGRIVAIGEKLADADEAAESMSDRCGSVPSIKFEDAVSPNTR